VDARQRHVVAFMSAMSGMLALNDDVVITPVRELPEELRTQAACALDDFAVTRTRERAGSSIVDADSMRLLDRFREPRTLVDAVILFAREQHKEANDVLESAYPFLKNMVQRRVLVRADSLELDTADESAGWTAGTRLTVGEIVRTLQVLDDTEVYLIKRPDQTHAILKLARHGSVPGGDPGRTRREARVLQWLDGRLGPRLLEDGELSGRHYLVLDFIPGADVEASTEEYQRSPARRQSVLDLAGRIVSAYSELHALGVLHGDVHPRNVLVQRDGSVRLIDFGFACTVGDTLLLPYDGERAGVPFFFEPEFARATIENTSAPPASSAGEQFAVAALLFLLATGEHWQRFHLGRREMMLDIAEGEPRSFSDCGAEPWPAFEGILRRALSRAPEDRWPSMAAFASQLTDLTLPAARAPAVIPDSADRAEQVLRHLEVDGPLFSGQLPAPGVSVNYGSAGIALGALHAAQRRQSPELLAASDAWIRRSLRQIEDEQGFYNDSIEITRDMVGEASPYHTPSGVHAVEALIARATGNTVRQNIAVGNYLQCAARPAAGIDLTLGRASTLLGAAILLDALPMAEASVEAALRAFGDQALKDIWLELDGKQRVGAGDVDYPGIAHGWAGFLYATLTWCTVAHAAVPGGLERRLDELAALALPAGRGLEWPWVLGQLGDPPTMSGWCNGSCGYVFLWTLAHRVFEKGRFLDLALGAGWNSWDSRDPASTLCCGLAGRGYALLNLHRHTGEQRWLERARLLGARALSDGMEYPEYRHSLYKGQLGVAVLAEDMTDPDWGRMPLFEPAGYRD
jgi:serine/threonine-protein kinase